MIFQGKVQAKAGWARGLFVSFSGFTEDGLQAFARGRTTSIVGMSGEDIYFILEGKMSLTHAIKAKVRHAVETGEFYTRIYQLALE